MEGEGTGGSYLLTHEAIMVSDVTECLLTLYVVDLDSLLVSTAERERERGKGKNTQRGCQKQCKIEKVRGRFSPSQ